MSADNKPWLRKVLADAARSKAQRRRSLVAPSGSERSWKLVWTNRNGTNQTGDAANDLVLISLLVDIIGGSDPRRITLKSNKYEL